MLNALDYCHQRCIAHRDIKLENVLLDERRNVKLIDFGFSTCVPNDKKIRLFCGTPSYMAPEIVKRTEFTGPPADIWATGVLLYALLCGTFPYRGSTDQELYSKICKGQYNEPEHLSSKAKTMLRRLMSINPDSRPSARSALTDGWLQPDP